MSTTVEETAPVTETTEEAKKVVDPPKPKSKRLAKKAQKNETTKVVTKPATAAAKQTKTKAPHHPSFITMISDAIKKLADRNGSSRQAIVKFIVNNYKLEEKFVNQHVKSVLKNGVKSGNIKQSKGVGASGSFKLGDKQKMQLKAKTEVKPAQQAPVKKTVKKVVKVTITKSKPAAKKIETKPKKNISKVVRMVAKKPMTKPVTKAAAVSRIKQTSTRTAAQPVRVQINVKKAANKSAARPVRKQPAKRATARKA